MTTRIGPSSSEVTYVTSAPRPTPTPPNVKFAEVLATQAGALARGAEAAVRSLPGGPLVALAIRGPAGSFGATPSLLVPRGGNVPVGAASPEGPGAASAGASGVGASGGAAAGGDPALEASMSQSQEMNLYFLRIQEEINAQNRTYSALSNVLKAQHDTVKNAIGNIR